MRLYYLILLSGLFFSACTVDEKIKTEDDLLKAELLKVPSEFPEISFPADNEFSIERWRLGKRLFFDPIMSSDRSVSCGSCHNQTFAFADNKSISPGVENRLGIRNAPSLANVAFLPHLLAEGGVKTLEQQVLVPIQEHEEFDNNILTIAERMNEEQDYVDASLNAYDRIPDPFVIVRALSTFQRTLISGESDYDKFMNEEIELSEDVLRGKELFFSEELACTECHGDFLFTNYSFQNNGLYEEYEDDGRFRLTLNEADRALFKVPSLRNVALTAPYMHNGSIESLEDVIEHYDSGGENHPNKSAFIKPLNLSSSEKEELIAFLNSLTDHRFINNPLFKP